MQYIGIFKGTPIATTTDGTEVSSEHAMTSPVNSQLNRNSSEMQVLAVRCEAGYEGTDITISGCTYDETTGQYTDGCLFLQFSKQFAGDSTVWSDSITFSSVGDTNTVFYCKITSGLEAGVIDTGSIKVSGYVDLAS